MKSTLLFTVVLIFSLAKMGLAQNVDVEKEFESLINAERQFSKMSAEKGRVSAFLTYLADDAILFRPGPVNGKKWFIVKDIVRRI